MADLITISDYKKINGLSTTNTEVDFSLSSFIASVSQLVKTYCANSIVDFNSTTKVETFTLNFAQHFIQLSETPLVVISGSKPIVVKERKTIGATYTTLTQNTDYYADTVTDSVFRSDGSSGYKDFPTGPGAVEVTYYAGYNGVPADLKLAVSDLVTYYFRGEMKPRQTIAGASRQQVPTSTQRDNVDFPDHIKRVLDLYKNY